MTRPLNHSDIKLIRSVADGKRFLLVSTPTPTPAREGAAANRADRARLSHGNLQALWPGRLSLRRWARTRTRKRYLSTIARTGERPRLGYVPNAIYPKVAEFLGNYRTLQEMLNEICAINAELLRRRESLD